MSRYKGSCAGSEIFIVPGNRLAKAIDSSTYLLADLRNFNESEWTVRYPTLTPVHHVEEPPAGILHRPKPKRGKTVSMSLTFADQPDCAQEVHVEQTVEQREEAPGRPARRTFRRSITAAQSRSVAQDTAEPATTEEGTSDNTLDPEADMDGFSILRLDLSLGHASSTPQGTAATLITSLEKHSISRLISSRLESSLKQSQFASASDVKKVKFEYRVNPSIQGGLEVHFGDRTVDLSVSSRVNKLNALLRGTSNPLTDRVDLDIGSRDSSLDLLAIHCLRARVVMRHDARHRDAHSP